MIEVCEVSKHYGPVAALRQCSFRVPTGNIVGLVGKNGAGKTTALSILSGQLLPSRGQVTIDGEHLAGRDVRWRGRVGYLPEMPPLYPEMTVAAFLRFAGRLRRVPSADLNSRVEQVISATGLVRVSETRLGALARGYRQRVGIAQAIIHDPPVVLLDEPMTGLDPLQIVQIRALIVSLRPRHTVLFSSHILSEVTQVCDRVVLLDEGTVKAQGSENDLRRNVLHLRGLNLLLRGTLARVREVLAPLGSNSLEVQEAPTEGTGLVRAHLVAEADLREIASRRCVEAGLGVLELGEVRDGLEQLMMQLLEEAGPVSAAPGATA